MELVPSVTAVPEDDDDNVFIGRAYRVLFAALTGIALFGLASYRWLPPSWAVPLESADGALWMLCGWFGWRRPTAVVFPIFSVVTGLCLGQVAHASPATFLYAAILTLTAFGGLTAYVHFTKQDFSFLRWFLWISFWFLVVGGVCVPLNHRHWEQVAYAVLGVLVFFAWILYDTSQLIQEELVPEDAAFELLLDIVALHSWLLDLIEIVTGRSSEEQS